LINPTCIYFWNKITKFKEFSYPQMVN
jgi:hypothetical protein